MPRLPGWMSSQAKAVPAKKAKTSHTESPKKAPEVKTEPKDRKEILPQVKEEIDDEAKVISIRNAQRILSQRLKNELEVKQEVKEEVEEVKIESSDDERLSDISEGEVSEAISEASAVSEQKPIRRTPQVQEFLRHAQINRDWDPSSRKYDETKWGNNMEWLDCESMCWTHASISETFRNGPHKGFSLMSLTHALLNGQTTLTDVPALVGIKDQQGIVWIVSGNRRLYALRAYVDELRKKGATTTATMVNVWCLVFNLAEMDDFPKSLFARCVEAFSGNGCSPSLRSTLRQNISTTSHSAARRFTNRLVGGIVGQDEGKDIFERSGLPVQELSFIWQLADRDGDGSLVFPEFAMAMAMVARQ
eukprot:symbB.v1.2.018321.t1/scaffold1456.1/size117650/11